MPSDKIQNPCSATTCVKIQQIAVTNRVTFQKLGNDATPSGAATCVQIFIRNTVRTRVGRFARTETPNEEIVMNTVPETLEAKIARLETENARLKAAKARGGIRVSVKGAVSLYGLGRWPVTLYAGQWEALRVKLPDVLAFIASNPAGMTRKAED